MSGWVWPNQPYSTWQSKAWLIWLQDTAGPLEVASNSRNSKSSQSSWSEDCSASWIPADSSSWNEGVGTLRAGTLFAHYLPCLLTFLIFLWLNILTYLTCLSNLKWVHSTGHGPHGQGGAPLSISTKKEQPKRKEKRPLGPLGPLGPLRSEIRSSLHEVRSEWSRWSLTSVSFSFYGPKTSTIFHLQIVLSFSWPGESRPLILFTTTIRLEKPLVSQWMCQATFMSSIIQPKHLWADWAVQVIYGNIVAKGMTRV